MCSLVAVSIHIGLPCPGSTSIIHHAPKAGRQRPQTGSANLNGKRPMPRMRFICVQGSLWIAMDAIWPLRCTFDWIKIPFKWLYATKLF
ncbi:LOW QUALITY PROTEIN: uncharacterized protein Dsimw501_GD17924 [Drosophila simulans]|uniref:Uncharacterized protein n=1 Tax=Drosophila simulans TaxID=7240 RepID=A0A0J9RU16_DROSI|nr:LOW QUALITY PROTEIN: uncharacterized protein Dsimw501_GD17924 [Drosophila simulans]